MSATDTPAEAPAPVSAEKTAEEKIVATLVKAYQEGRQLAGNDVLRAAELPVSLESRQVLSGMVASGVLVQDKRTLSYSLVEASKYMA